MTTPCHRPMTQYLTIKQLAARLAVSYEQARKLVLSGRIPKINVGLAKRPVYRVAESDVAALAEEAGGGKPSTGRVARLTGPKDFAKRVAAIEADLRKGSRRR